MGEPISVLPDHRLMTRPTHCVCRAIAPERPIFEADLISRCSGADLQDLLSHAAHADQPMGQTIPVSQSQSVFE